PRENVLFVPSRNVLLTGSGWGGDGPRSFDHDPAGERPAGSSQEGIQEADQTIAGSQGVGGVGEADPALAEAAQSRGRQGGDPRFARPRVESENEQGAAREDHPDPVAGGVSGIWADAGERVPGEEAPDRDRAG